MSDQVCGIIVTYHPDENLEKNIAALRGQVGALILVDNGSGDSQLHRLRELAGLYSFVLVENGDNLGIGSALNLGIRRTAALGFRYVALFDQDSEVSDRFIDPLLDCLERQHGKRVLLAAPRILVRNTGAIGGPGDGDEGQYLVAQTSGSLMPLEVFASQGWFNEDLFIDYVDYDYCLRAVTAGWVILRCDDAILSHSPGNCRRHSFLGVYLGTSMDYSAQRHYYSTRNGAWVLRKYWRRHPRWCARQAFLMIKEKIKPFVFERNAFEKLRLSMLGLRDGLRGDLGRRDFSSGSLSTKNK